MLDSILGSPLTLYSQPCVKDTNISRPKSIHFSGARCHSLVLVSSLTWITMEFLTGVAPPLPHCGQGHIPNDVIPLFKSTAKAPQGSEDQVQTWPCLTGPVKLSSLAPHLPPSLGLKKLTLFFSFNRPHTFSLASRILSLLFALPGTYFWVTRFFLVSIQI